MTYTSQTTPGAYLIALSMSHAASTATVDWGWEKVGRDLYRSKSGELVRAVPDVETLRGLPRSTRLFLGFAWFDRHDHNEINYLLEAGRFVKVQP